jgi:hypothetical protein
MIGFVLSYIGASNEPGILYHYSEADSTPSELILFQGRGESSVILKALPSLQVARKQNRIVCQWSFLPHVTKIPYGPGEVCAVVRDS